MTIFPETVTIQVAIENEEETIKTFPKDIVEGKMIVMVPPLGIGSNVCNEKA